MKAQINYNDSLSESIFIDNGVKQDDIPVLTFCYIYLAVTFLYAF